MNTTMPEVLRKLDKKIATLRQREYLPTALLDLLDKVTRLQLTTQAGLDPVVPLESALPPADLRAQGRALIERTAFPYDPVSGRTLFVEIAGLAAESGSSLAASATAVQAALASGELDLDAAFAAYVHNEDSFFAPWRSKFPQAPRTLDFLVRSSLVPGIAAAATKLLPYVIEQSCEFGHCPVCGDQPLIGALSGKEGQRRLTCSFCLTDYAFRRIHCPYCGERDFEKLSFIEAVEEPAFRAETCQTCQQYIKTVDVRNLDKHSLPIIDDLESLPLDILATRRGFTRPTLSAWGF